MAWLWGVALISCLVFNLPASATETHASIPEQYKVEALQWPDTDRSGEVGQRLLRLLNIQVGKGLRWIEKEQAASGVGEDQFIIRGSTNSGVLRAYDLGQTVSCLFAISILARCGQPGETMAGTTRENLEGTAVTLVHAVLDSHPAGGGPNPHADWWDNFWGMRLQYHLSMGAWLIWDSLDAPTRLRLAKVLERDADLFLGKPAPARLRNDTQAESNAWNGAGLAAVARLLKHHPHRAAWADKAKELMLSAYATQNDVDSPRLVDGKPLNQWLTGPNAFSDYTVENHGFVHPDYIAASSELVRSAIAFRLAGEPIPDAATFNADKTLDVLLCMTLPGSHYLYTQGTDYCTRRLDSFFQACNVIPLKSDPLRNACFLRSLASLEKMAAERPDLPMCGWLGLPYEFGTLWGLTENYMMRRLFGPGGEAVPDGQIEQRLTGVRIFEEGMFAIHRTPSSISSFSWHTTARKSPPMGMTLPLDRDALIYPMPGSLIGELREATDTSGSGVDERPDVRWHHAEVKDGGLSVLMELLRCGGKVAQNCAFVSLPDGSSVYLEKRVAEKAVTLARATSGNVVINDDVRWVYQSKPRRFLGELGELMPSDSARFKTRWLNIDDRQGYVTLGGAPLRLNTVAGKPGIWRQNGTMYDTCRMEFVQLPHGDKAGAGRAQFEAGQHIGSFALIALPNVASRETKVLADEMTDWVANEADCLAAKVNTYVVYANFSTAARRIAGTGAKEFPKKTCGWIQASEPAVPRR